MTNGCVPGAGLESWVGSMPCSGGVLAPGADTGAGAGASLEPTWRCIKGLPRVHPPRCVHALLHHHPTRTLSHERNIVMMLADEEAAGSCQT